MFVNFFIKVLAVGFFSACLFSGKATSTLPPPDTHWNLSIEKIVNAGFLKEGGSDVFHYYIQYWLNKLDITLQTQPHQTTWKQLCRDSDCSKGLDLKKIDKPTIRNIIKQLADQPFVATTSNAPHTEAFIFLQGNLGPAPDEKAQTPQNPEKYPKHIEGILLAIEYMKFANVRRIVVNLAPQPHLDLIPFVLLGQFIKENQMDLHIVGRCGPYCARYLIPAAKTVYMEPYGHIYFNGSFTGLFEEIQKVMSVQQAAYIKQWEKQWLPELKDKIGFVTSSIQEAFDDSNTDVPTQQRNALFIKLLKRFDPEAGKEFEKRLSDFQFNKSAGSLTNFKEEDIKSLLQSFSSKLRNSLALLFNLMTDDTAQNNSRYLRELNHFRQEESKYYQHISISALPSQKSYTYLSLLRLAAALTKDLKYEKYFSVPRLYYNIPEKDKPYLMIFPSADLLRDVGINIRGKNNMKMAGLTDENSQNGFLYLDNKRIENCKFFEKGVSYTTETLYNCLF